MLLMADINSIRNSRNNHGKSINHIRKEFGINWRTAKKYADEDFIPESKIKERTGMMYTEKWGEIVSLWLSEDSRLPRKKRRTNKHFYSELVQQGFSGSYRTVCNFVQEWRATHPIEANVDKGYERLEHPPSEAQLDFGTMEVMHDDAFKVIKVLVMTFPYSNAGFAVALPAENQECLLEGMKELFSQIGGVPRKIRIDNMSTAVLKRKSRFEDATLTDGFLQFQIHYGFETQVCNPRSGHEKGSVENKVGYVRYNFFSEVPVMKDFENINKDLAIKLSKDRNEIHYEKNVCINDLWIEENSDLLALPDTNYPVFKEIEVKANKYNEVVIDKTRIHVPRAKNHARIYVQLTYDSYRMYGSDKSLISEGPRPYMNKKVKIEWTGILMDWRKKLRCMHYSRYWKYLPARIKLYLSCPDLKEQSERLNKLIDLLVTSDMAKIDQEFYELIQSQESTCVYDVNWDIYDDFLKLPSENKGA